MALRATPIKYLKQATPHDAIVHDHSEQGVVSSLDTWFYVDHKEPLAVLKKVIHGAWRGAWVFGHCHCLDSRARSLTGSLTVKSSSVTKWPWHSAWRIEGHTFVKYPTGTLALWNSSVRWHCIKIVRTIQIPSSKHWLPFMSLPWPYTILADAGILFSELMHLARTAKCSLGITFRLLFC